jgi:caffeoyl-CoA O-methyltransferase
MEEFSSAGTEAERTLLDELERATNRKVVHPQMVSGRTQGIFLTIITGILRPRLALEIGTFTGYSALSIAAGLDEGAEIHTIEVDDELEDLARGFFARSLHGHKIHLHIGSALDIAPRLIAPQPIPPRPAAPRTVGQGQGDGGAPGPTCFDLIYIDGDKREYPDYYRMIMGDSTGAGGRAMVGPGTVILTDNVLWYGKVAGLKADERNAAPGSPDGHTAGIVEFNRLVAADTRVENVILPLRDGINLIRVK